MILDAARACLVERGYRATTITEVAAQAGVSRGLLHYYFENKEDMMAKVVEASMQSSLELLGPLLASSESGAQMASTLTKVMKSLLLGDASTFKLFFEAWSVARGSERVRQELVTLFRRFRTVTTAGLIGAQARGAIAPSLPPEKLATLVTGLLDGFALQLLVEPELGDDESLWTSLESALLGLLGAQ